MPLTKPTSEDYLAAVGELADIAHRLSRFRDTSNRLNLGQEFQIERAESLVGEIEKVVKVKAFDADQPK